MLFETFKTQGSKIVLGIIILSTFLKLWKLNGGLVFGEPDEWVYWEISQNFSHTLKPIFEGRFFFDSPPLYTWLGYFLSQIVTEKFLALRLISVVSASLLAYLLFVYLKEKFTYPQALLAVMLFLILPISLYYSRLGLMEMFLAMLSFLTMHLTERAFAKKSLKLAFWAGLSLAAVFMTKFTGVIILVSLLLFCLTQIITISGKKVVFGKEALKISFVILFSAGIILGVFFGAYLLIGRGEFIASVKEKLGSVNFISPIAYLELSTRVLTIEFSLIAFLGLLLALVKRKQALLFPALVVVIGLYSIARLPTERYFVMLVPFLVVFAVYCLQIIVERLAKFRILDSTKAYILTVMVALILFLPKSEVAFYSTDHALAEETAQVVKDLKEEKGWEDKWVFTDYWPSAFTQGVGYKTTWLTSQTDDAQAFSTVTNQYTKIATDSYTVLKQEGGIVVIEELYSDWLSSSAKRAQPINVVTEQYQPVKEITDNKPNWPFFTQKQNRTLIYLIEAKTKTD